MPGCSASTLWRRFWSKVDATGDCWLWTANQYSNGYGCIRTVGYSRGLAHRVAWTLLVGPIPPGMDLDHLCRNRRCVNPDHLQPVTRAENLRRSGGTAAAANRRKTHCPRGHPYHGTNLYVAPRGNRICRACANIARRRWANGRGTPRRTH